MKTTFNFGKLQNDVLTAAAKREMNGTYFKWLYGNVKINNGKCAVLCDGYAAWFIPASCYFLDNERVFDGRQPLKAERFIENVESAAPVYDTGITTEFNDGKKNNRKCRVLKMENNEEIWIDTVFLKYFDVNCMHFTGTGPKAPVYCYNEYNQLIGLVLPVNHGSATVAPARQDTTASAETATAPETAPAKAEAAPAAEAPVETAETAKENAGEQAKAEAAPENAPKIEKAPAKSAKKAAKAAKKSEKAAKKVETAPAPAETPAEPKKSDPVTYEIKDGTKPGANEIYFSRKPSRDVRDKLIKLRMKWHNVKKCWYGYVERADILAAVQTA